MKEGWEYKTLGECCDVNYGTRVVRSKVSGSEFPVYGGGGETFRINCYNRENCLVVARFAMSKQCTRYVNGKFFLNDSGLTVSPKKDSCLTKELLEKYLFANNDLIYSFGRGSAQRNLNMSEFRSMLISFPIDNNEQRRIVSYLDSSFKLIDEIKNKALKSLTEAKALFQSALAEAMEPKEGWEKKTLGEIAEIKGGKRVPKGYKLLTEPTNHKYIRVADFNDFGSITLENIQYISDEVYNQIKRYTISSKDVYISIAGTIGKSGIIPKELEGANLTENACKLVLDSCAYKYFVYYFTKSALFLNQIKKLTMISAQPKLALTRLATVNIPLPNLSTQKQIVSHLDSLSSKVQAIEEKYQKMVEECDALKQAMLRDVFE